jgi:polysaccharide pyruvyl transferase WcaK-like protein
MEIEPSLEMFVARSDMMVLGGGGLMTPVLKGATRITADMRDLVRICRETGIPIYGISLGGNGTPLKSIEPIERRELIAASEYTTLRNPEDMQVLEELSRTGACFPDIVWSVPRMFRPKSRPPDERQARRTIGVNIYTRNAGKRKWLQRLLKAIVRYRSDLDFLFISVSSDFNLNNGTLGSADWGRNCRTVALHEIEAAVDCLASLDCLITSKLHIGMTAMSLGVPVVSYAGEPKTKLVFKRIGLGGMAWTSRELHKIAWLFLSRNGLRALRDSFAKIDRESLINAAMNHYAKLTEIVMSRNFDAAESDARA